MDVHLARMLRNGSLAHSLHWDGLKNNFSAAVGMSLTHLRNQKKERPKSSGLARIMDKSGHQKIILSIKGNSL